MYILILLLDDASFFTFKTFADCWITLKDFNNYLITLPIYSFPFDVYFQITKFDLLSY